MRPGGLDVKVRRRGRGGIARHALSGSHLDLAAVIRRRGLREDEALEDGVMYRISSAIDHLAVHRRISYTALKLR